MQMPTKGFMHMQNLRNKGKRMWGNQREKLY